MPTVHNFQVKKDKKDLVCRGYHNVASYGCLDMHSCVRLYMCNNKQTIPGVTHYV